MKRILLILLCAVTLCTNAQVVDTAKRNLRDTIKKDIFTAPDTVKKLHSKTLALIVPAALIGYGVASFAVKPIRNFDYYVAGRLESATPNFHTSAESYFLFTPVVMVYGLNLVGVEGENRFIDRTAILGLAGGMLELTDFSLKHATHRLRPNGADYYSFPSAHTGAAFMGAEFLSQEYGDQSPVYTVIGYTAAVTTGIFRMANRDHWFSDVVAGAGFGILSAKAAYFVYPYLRSKLTHTGKTGKMTMIMPSFQNGAPGLSFAAIL